MLPATLFPLPSENLNLNFLSIEQNNMKVGWVTMVDKAEYSFRSCGFLCYTRVGQHGGRNRVDHRYSESFLITCCTLATFYSLDICEDCD